jgi:hypothetical protein
VHGGYGAAALAAMGIDAATSVPPSAGHSISSRPSSAASRSLRPWRPLLRADAADPVVSDLDAERPILDPRGDRDDRGPGVLRDVGERLGDDEVRRRLDRGGQAVREDLGPHRHRHVVSTTPRAAGRAVCGRDPIGRARVAIAAGIRARTFVR